MTGYTYILASRKNGTLYTGVTADIAARIYQHRIDVGSKFTSQYDVKRLVWYETHNDITDAITREKQIKKWNRAWKVRLIEEINPNWDDLYLKF